MLLHTKARVGDIMKVSLEKQGMVIGVDCIRYSSDEYPFCSIRNSIIHSFIHSFIRSFVHSVVLQLFVGPWPLLQFRNIFYTDDRTTWASDQPVARPLHTYRTSQTQNKSTRRYNTYSGTRTHHPSVRARTF
jgi:hypothetical protein